MGVVSANAYARLTLNIKQTQTQSGLLITLYGELKPAKVGVNVAIQANVNGSWQKTSMTTKTKSGGAWKITRMSTALSGSAKYRAVSNNIFSTTRTFSIDKASAITEADPNLLISLSGPGGRVHGADISKWQHPGGQLIDFTKMYAAGIRFVIIKASDGRDSSDIDARKWLPVDRNAAQSAGIYTGFYHYANLPDSSDPNTVITEAKTQAQKAIWRLASLSGYDNQDLPYALDLENNCIRPSGNSCQLYASKKMVTLFATTWLATVRDATGRTPMIYSYSQFLENAMVRNDELRQYPLWLAQYGVNPADPLGQPGQKIAGCYVHTWTTSNCTSDWTVWQYTSCGIGSKYGIPSARVDLNVFRGNIDTFIQLTKGIWVPQLTDMMPINEPTTMNLISSTITSTDDPAIFVANVLRPNGQPVVTGTIKLTLPDKTIKTNQSVTRGKDGAFSLKVVGIPVGTWQASIDFADQSGTHAIASVPIQFQMVQGTKPVPTATPTPKPGTSTSSDGCKGQIIN